MLQSAREQAMRGNFLRARQLAATASMLPVEWPSPDESAAAFLDELQSFPGFAEAIRNPQHPVAKNSPSDAAVAESNPTPEEPARSENPPSDPAFAGETPQPHQALAETPPTEPATETQPWEKSEKPKAPAHAGHSVVESATVPQWTAQRETPQRELQTESVAAAGQSPPAASAPAPAVKPSDEPLPEILAKSDPLPPQPAAETVQEHQPDIVVVNHTTGSAAPGIQPAGRIEIVRGTVQPAGGIEIYRGSVRQGAGAVSALPKVVAPLSTPVARSTNSTDTKSRTDFYRDEARTLLEQARRKALQGEFLKARQLAKNASMLPVDWEPGDSPQTFLSELESFPGYAEAIGGKPFPVELSAIPGTTKPQASSEAALQIQPLRVAMDPDHSRAQRPAAAPDERSQLRRLSKVDTSAQKPSALGGRAGDVDSLRPSAPSDVADLNAARLGGGSADRVKVAAGFLPPTPSRGETLFTNVLINLITIFAALVFGLFALLSAGMLVLKNKLKGGGLNLRVELVTNQPLANFSVTSGAVPVAGTYVAAPAAATQAAPASAVSRQGDQSEDADDFNPVILDFGPPILSIAQQREAEEQEMRLKEQAILAQILENNVELREQLQEMEGLSK